MRMPGQSWLGSITMYLSMWAAMMVAMMLPSLMIKLHLLHRSLVWRRASHAGLSTLLVACGYFTVWSAVGFGVYAVGIPWALATMQWEGLSRAAPFLTGILLVAAGVYQFTPVKSAGLQHCRNLLVYGPEPKRRKQSQRKTMDQTFAPVPEMMKDAGMKDSVTYGLREGWRCGVCCAGYTLALVILGAMNFFVMFAVALLISLEKLLPKPGGFVRLTGTLSLAAGLIIAIRPFW
jgi:predicted metal-binding membrane protein